GQAAGQALAPGFWAGRAGGGDGDMLAGVIRPVTWKTRPTRGRVVYGSSITRRPLDGFPQSARTSPAGRTPEPHRPARRRNVTTRRDAGTAPRGRATGGSSGRRRSASSTSGLPRRRWGRRAGR